MKTCTDCKLQKPLDEFATRSAKCKPCHREYTREHYQKNKEAYATKARRNSAKYQQAIREHVWNYLLEHPCIGCGETDPRVLEFDHINPALKKFSISEAVSKVSSVTKVQEEIDKCQVLCANCHRRKTYEQFGWWTG